jgi:predicted Zn-dependent protease
MNDRPAEPTPQPSTTEPPSAELAVKHKPGNRRLWWLIVVLLLTLHALVWQRQAIAGWIGRRAMERASRDDMVAARDWLRVAEWISPYAPETALATARIHRREGDLTEFGRELRRAEQLGIDPELSFRESLLASAQSGQMSIAGPQLASLLETAGGDEAEICEAYAQGYMRVRDFPSALAMLHAWAGDFPKDARPHAWIGQIQAELSASEAAEAAFRTALRLDPKNASAAFGLGQLLLDLKRPADAIPLFRIATSDPSLGASATVGLASALKAESRAEEAEAALDEALLRFPDDYRLLVEKANSAVEQGRYAEAESALREEIEAGSNRREVRYTYALALRGLGRIDEATSHFEYATEAAKNTAIANRLVNQVNEEPGNLPLRFTIGSTLLRYGNIEDGLMWLQSVLDADPRHQPTHQALAEYYESQVARHPRWITQARRHRVQAGPAPLSLPADSPAAADSPPPADAGEETPPATPTDPAP